MSDTLRGYFWAYDVFGYLLPGLVLMALVASGGGTTGTAIVSLWTSEHWQNVFVVAGFAYVVGHIVSAISSWLLERQLLRRCYGWPTQRMFEQMHTQGWFSRSVAGATLWMIPEYDRAYSSSFRDRFDAAFHRRLGDPPVEYHDRFWLAWNYVAQHHLIAHRRATHFLELYGFCRNLAMALLLACGLPLIPTWTLPVEWWKWYPVCAGSALFLFSNYGKLLRRLNDEVFRAFVSLDMTPPEAVSGSTSA